MFTINSINTVSDWFIQNRVVILNHITNTIIAIIIFSLGIITSRVITNIINRIMLTHNIDATVVGFICVLIRYGINTFVFIVALGCIGVQTTSIIAMLGAAGLAVGLALQGSLSNLAAGVLLVIFRPFRSGEYVDLGGITGTVLQIQIFSTTLRNVDGRIAVIPNSKIITGNIINFSQPVRRIEFIINVSYDSDIDKVKKLLFNIIKSDERILKDREIIVRLHELGDYSINFIARGWSKINNLQYVRWDILERIKKEFDINGINFPFKQIDINLKNIDSNNKL